MQPLTPENFEPDQIHIYSTVAADKRTPMVGWRLNGTGGTLSLTEAREQATTLFLAAAIAETEARIALKLSGLKEHKPKGFGKKPTEVEKAFYSITMLMREERPLLPEGVRPIFGWKSQQPLVEIDFYGELVRLPVEDTKNHARWLIEVADGAESDCFFYGFLKEKLDISAEVANGFLQEFSEFRKRVQLEDLLRL
jgi:hypothetical protein